ncbi:MAG: ABC transporter substrate-binding protein [Treponema sp.]|jgi:ABC-type glycerol-3-phosphate transport system substrate-binding protein|nr:ABC transporter substrate-binding protein [Treponema sp.]
MKYTIFPVVIFSFVFFLFLSACSGKKQDSASAPAADNSSGTAAAEKKPGRAKYTQDGKRIITIGTWYDKYYVSKHRDINEDPKMVDPVSAELQLKKIREIEAKHNIVLRYVNLTFDGVQESINTSIPAGIPDVDIYEVDLQFGIPAVLHNYAVSLEEMGLGDTDVFKDQVVMKYLNVLGQRENFLFMPSNGGGIGAYVLAFNMDLIRKAGLENPQDLYDRGEWTWNKWRDYLKKITQDTDDDGIPNIYGWSGYWNWMLANLLLSNQAGIAPGPEEKLSDPKTREVFQFIYDIYNTDKTARPWDSSNWEINNRLYAEGLSGFWIGADWIFNESGGANLPFEIGVSPWPCGPSGSFENNRHSQPSGNWFLIPKGVADPRFVYDVMYDWFNWYDGDLSIARVNEWSKTMYMNNRNFNYALMMSMKPGFDVWQTLEMDLNLYPLIAGEAGPDDIIVEYKDMVQAALDSYFK